MRHSSRHPVTTLGKHPRPIPAFPPRPRVFIMVACLLPAFPPRKGFAVLFAKLGIWPWVPEVLRPILLLLGIFLILLVLIQRGKGGGLAGAFGGVGGSSAFGSRAGDLFTRITIITAGIWILLLMFQVYAVQTVAERKQQEGSLSAPANPGQ